MSERRRVPRFDVTAPARLLLAGGRSAPVILRNVGELGALVSIGDLELAISAGERALLEHPAFVDGHATERRLRTPAFVVRVDLDLDLEGDRLDRQVALHFDGGALPEGVA